MGDRSRSRSPRADAGTVSMGQPWANKQKSDEPPKTQEEEAIERLCEPIRIRLTSLFDEGTLRKGDLDLKSIVTLGALQEPLQVKVMEHMENDRVFLANARSKSGFLIAATDKAKRGELDVRGFGAIDPWKATLEALRCRQYSWVKWRAMEFEPEDVFYEQNGGADTIVNLTIDVSACPDASVESVDVSVPLKATIDEIKDKVVAAGIFVPKPKMQIQAPMPTGSMRARETLAFYNITDGTKLKVGLKKRGGTKHTIDAKVLEFGG